MENTATPTETFEEALARFVGAMQQAINEHFAREYTRLTPPALTYELGATGQKYVRIVQEDRGGGTSRSAWAFVEISTGNILKCDGWKRPAKGVRGTIYTQNFAAYGCTTYGPKYNR